MSIDYEYDDELYHHGIKGQKWGVRRYQNDDGTLTDAGRKRYGVSTTGHVITRDNIRSAESQAYLNRLYGPDRRRVERRVIKKGRNVGLGITAAGTGYTKDSKANGRKVKAFVGTAHGQKGLLTYISEEPTAKETARYIKKQRRKKDRLDRKKAKAVRRFKRSATAAGILTAATLGTTAAAGALAVSKIRNDQRMANAAREAEAANRKRAAEDAEYLRDKLGSRYYSDRASAKREIRDRMHQHLDDTPKVMKSDSHYVHTKYAHKRTSKKKK